MYFCRIIRKPRSIRFMTGATMFFILFAGFVGGFIYRDMRDSEITKAEQLEVMQKAVDAAGKEATRQAQRMLEDNRAGKE